MTRGNPFLQVAPHAVVRAKQRYGLANVDWLLIHDDVYGAIMAGRAGKDHPSGSGKRADDGRIFAWTENLLRIYVAAAFQNRDGRVCLRVLTALPGVYRERVGSSEDRRAA